MTGSLAALDRNDLVVASCNAASSVLCCAAALRCAVPRCDVLCYAVTSVYDCCIVMQQWTMLLVSSIHTLLCLTVICNP